MASEFRTEDALSHAIDVIAAILRRSWGERDYIKTDLGVHEVTITADEDGDEYALVSFMLGGSTSTPTVHAEIEDGTYGILQGFRIYKEDL